MLELMMIVLWNAQLSLSCFFADCIIYFTDDIFITVASGRESIDFIESGHISSICRKELVVHICAQ